MSMQNGKIIDQRAYLKKYLSGDKGKKKKKKDKKHKKAEAKVKVIDDDAYGGLNEEVDEDLLLGGEDAPQIVGEYIEDDPNVRSKWRNIAVKDEPKQEDDASEVRIKEEPKDETENESDLWGRKTAAIKIKDEFSPSRRRRPEPSQQPITIKQEKRSSSRDQTPVRGEQTVSQDESPPRRKRDKDQSPTRHNAKYKVEHSPDQSPARRRRDSDQSPPRRRRDADADQSPPRRRRNSDQSPPRRRRDTEQTGQRRHRDPKQSPPRRRRSTSRDQSPARRRLKQTPPRRRRSRSRDQSPRRKQRRSASSDQSPPRRGRSRETSSRRRPDHSPVQRVQKQERRSVSPAPARKSRWARATPSKSLSPPPTHKPKNARTLDGKKAGLQDAQSLKAETDERRRQEQRLFEQMSSEVSGRNAEVQMRSTGRRGKRARDAAAEDPAEQRRKEEHEQKKKELYARWGKGLKQVEDQKARLAEMAHEASKPVARYANDEDLERHLREKEYADDPMLEYMRKKRKKREEQTNEPKMPVYEGTYPENRFGIRPGYRWDGVDRSNGYEQRWFDKQNEKRAVQDEAYKYSVEDM